MPNASLLDGAVTLTINLDSQGRLLGITLVTTIVVQVQVIRLTNGNTIYSEALQPGTYNQDVPGRFRWDHASENWGIQISPMERL